MSASNVALIKLPGHFAQVQLSGLKEIVEHHRENGHQVQFDAEEVERIDGAAVQFLLAISQMQSAQTDHLVVNTNEVLLNAFNDMGVIDLLKADATESETAKDATDAA